MKECKLPIQQDHFLEKQSRSSRNIAVVAAVLLFAAMSLMTVFTFQSINGLSTLRQEVDQLKAAVKLMQQKVEQDKDTAKDTPSISPSDYSDDPLWTDYEYPEGDYGSYENYENDEYDYDNSTESLTGQNYTKDAKNTTSAPRKKRSIIRYNQEESSQEYEERKDSKKKYRSSTPPPSSYSYPLYPELKTHQNPEQTTPTPRQIYTRRLHVYQDNNLHEPTTSGRAEDTHTSQEKSEVELVDERPTTRTRHRQRRLEFDDRHVRTGRMRPLPVAHFSGDTSKYVLGQHDNFKGNGHLSHPHRIFVDWTESSWFSTLGMDRHFALSDGVLRIKEAGLYFIYAQIYYYDEHDINGFRVHRNDNETLLQCTTTTHSIDRVLKGNTCFTAAAEYLNENDQISIGDISTSRYSLFEPGKSFFGVIKLGDVKIK